MQRYKTLQDHAAVLISATPGWEPSKEVLKIFLGLIAAASSGPHYHPAAYALLNSILVFSEAVTHGIGLRDSLKVSLEDGVAAYLGVTENSALSHLVRHLS